MKKVLFLLCVLLSINSVSAGAMQRVSVAFLKGVAAISNLFSSKSKGPMVHVICACDPYSLSNGERGAGMSCCSSSSVEEFPGVTCMRTAQLPPDTLQKYIEEYHIPDSYNLIVPKNSVKCIVECVDEDGNPLGYSIIVIDGEEWILVEPLLP